MRRERMRGVWIALLLLPLAGCLGGDTLGPPPPAQVPLGGPLQGAGTYAFAHPGGTLAFAVAGGDAADVDLYGPDDARAGRFSLDANRSSVTVQADTPGAWVLRIVTLEGNLTVTAAGAPVADFLPLADHVERHVLVARSAPLSPLVPGTSLLAWPLPRQEAAVNLTRTPTDLRLLASGSHQDLHVTVRGASGPVLEADGSRQDVGLLTPNLSPIPYTFLPENVRDGVLEAVFAADHFDGTLVLESWSFSRAAPARNAPVHPAPGAPPAFDHGVLPTRPVAFEVHPAADHIVVWSAAHATVALWRPDGSRLATLDLSPDAPRMVMVGGGGAYVGVSLEGEAHVGAPVAPADFEKHPLEIVVESGDAGPSSGPYHRSNATVGTAGVLWEVVMEGGGGMPLFGCAEALITVHQGNETRGVGSHDPARAARLLTDGPAVVVMEGLGDMCLDAAYTARSFVLP